MSRNCEACLRFCRSRRPDRSDRPCVDRHRVYPPLPRAEQPQGIIPLPAEEHPPPPSQGPETPPLQSQTPSEPAATSTADLDATVAAQVRYTDVSADGTHYPAITALGDLGIFDGTDCGQNRFCPTDALPRWAFAVWLVRILDGDDPTPRSSRFADVTGSPWWEPHVERLAELGVTAGCSTNPLRFCPDRSVNRAQMASFLARAFDLPSGPDPGFTDVTAGSTHSDDINALSASGITAGCRTEPLRYCPTTATTRAQMATFLHRANVRHKRLESIRHSSRDSYEQALAVAGRLAPGFVVPNDCRPPPLDSPHWMPNAPRGYRSGVHLGVDFLCSTAGHPVVSVLDGQVVVAAGGYQDPTLREWNEIMAVAAAVGSTPPYTLAMVSGRHVVVDHGIIDDVGHVVSLYAHLDAVDPAIAVGMPVDAGQRLGGIGNTGRRAGVLRVPYDADAGLHLHWNFYVNGQYLGAGLSESQTRDVYAELFKYATGTQPPPEPGTADAGTSPGDPDVGSFSPRPGLAGPGTLTFSGHKPLDEPLPLDQALEAATRLSGDIVVPSDCRSVPLSSPSALPNAARAYRSGTHQGIDFGCSALEEPVVAALAGRVVTAVGDFEDPAPEQRSRLLDTASALGATPEYTLVMLYGNYVAVDHGIIDGVGHVVSLYAHLDTLDADIRPGLWVEAGQRLGTIGNTGTYAGASGATHAQLRLQWELHIDGHYLGIGLSDADTRAVYTALFADESG